MIKYNDTIHNSRNNCSVMNMNHIVNSLIIVSTFIKNGDILLIPRFHGKLELIEEIRN